MYYESLILSNPPHEDIVVPCSNVTKPEDNGYSVTIGEYQGQDIDYEKRFTDGKRIHVRKFKDVYQAHWDIFSPIINPIQHLRYDAPHWWVTLCALGGASLGADSSDDESSLLVGGALGFLFGLVTLPKE